jgi:hypothetical protein
MEPPKRTVKPYKKPLVRVRLPLITRAKSKTLFEEYYYAFLLLFSGCIMLLLKAGGMSFYNAVVAGLWLGAIFFFLTQVIRYFRFRANPPGEAQSVATGPAAEKKLTHAAAQQMKLKVVPEKSHPGVQDTGVIKLVPKPGQQPRPPIITGTAPPSPFIKPPK